MVNIEGARKLVEGVVKVGPLLIPAVVAAGKKAKKTFQDLNPEVAITGVAGSGKSALAAGLGRAGEAAEKRYSTLLSGSPSATVEEVRVGSFFKKIRFDVIPGGAVAARGEALDKYFAGRPARGVIHVVSNGYRTPRPNDDIADSLSIESYRQDAFYEEVRDFITMCDRLGTLVRKSSHPIWLMIAINKCDLYRDDLQSALHYYTADLKSPFVKEIDRLRKTVGGGNLTIEHALCSSRTENFNLDGMSTISRGDVDADRKSLDDMLTRIRHLLER